jgi:hypothetical protein
VVWKRSGLMMAILILILVYIQYKSAYHPYFSQVSTSSWQSTLEPDPKGNDPDIHRLRYEYTIENSGNRSETVESVRPVLKNSMLSRVQNGSFVIKVNKKLKSNETITLQGEFKVKMDGSTDIDVNLAGGIERFEVVLKKKHFWFF